MTTGASFDLGSNDLIINYNNNGSPDPAQLTNVKGVIASAYANGAWTGTGFTSSAAAAIAANSSNHHKTGLGYAEASEINAGSHNGIGLDNDAIVVAYTYYGDANLDGTVDTSDFMALATNFGSTSATWQTGDFNYDGKVNALDFNAVATNFGAASLAAPGLALGSVVPEPGSLGLLALALGAFTGRRRRA